VSGINNGYNLGSDIFYSGTVGAAVEGALRGVPGVAVSLERRHPQDFRHAAAFLRALVAEILARGAAGQGKGQSVIPPSSILNVNVPQGEVRGYQVTVLGHRVYRDLVDVRQDLRGRSYYWIGGPEEKGPDVPGSDCSAVEAHLASVTPISLDLTHPSLGGDLRGWRIGHYVQTGGSLART
jgi:5'-nucleotidase